MRIEADIERGSYLHERAKTYANTHGLQLSRAYAELIETGLDAEGVQA